MKKIFKAKDAGFNFNFALLILRIGIGILMLTHALPKVEMLLSGGEVKFPSVLGMGGTLSLSFAVFAEFFCSILLMGGLATRIVVIPLIVTMIIAAFIIHAEDPFSVKEMSLHFLLTYLVLLLTGGGKYSIDYLIQKRIK